MEIMNYQEQSQSSSNKILATFDISLPKAQMIFRHWKVIRKKDGGWFCAPPSFKEGETEEGKMIFKSYIDFETNEKRKEFFEKLHDAIKPYVQVL